MLKLRHPITSCLLATAILSGAGVASAEDAHVKEMKFEIVAPWKSEINVTSTSHTTWDTILPNDLTVWVHMKVDTRWPGIVQWAGIFLGHCHNTQCGSFPRIYQEVVQQRDYNHQTYIDFSGSLIPVSSNGGIPVLPYGDEILRECNAHLQADGPTKAHSFSKTLAASFSVNTTKGATTHSDPVESGAQFNGGDHTVHGDFTVKVNCIPVPSEVQEPPPPHRHQVTVEGIKLFLTTYGGAAPAGRTPGASSCKPLKVTTRIETDKEGPVKVKLWRKIDNGPVTDEIRTLDAKALGGNKFGADWDKWEHFGKTTYAQYMAEIIGGTFAPSTPWKAITIHCAGNFADAPRPGDGPVAPDPEHPGLTTPPGGPRISCAGGKLNGDDCVCPRGAKEVKVGAHAYRCVADVDEPKTKISCAGGSVRGNDCVCPRGTKEVKLGAHAYRCAANPSEPKTKISCVGGSVRGNDCVCPRGTREVPAGANAYRCVRHTVGAAATRPSVNLNKKLVVPPRQRTGAMIGRRVVR